MYTGLIAHGEAFNIWRRGGKGEGVNRFSMVCPKCNRIVLFLTHTHDTHSFTNLCSHDEAAFLKSDTRSSQKRKTFGLSGNVTLCRDADTELPDSCSQYDD